MSFEDLLQSVEHAAAHDTLLSLDPPDVARVCKEVRRLRAALVEALEGSKEPHAMERGDCDATFRNSNGTPRACDCGADRRNAEIDAKIARVRAGEMP